MSSIRSTLFIAVQCFNCSTMQVKQKKKSSNKWTCAVCGSRQSVTRLHAQGFMAKDVRKFVQIFNMRRKIEDEAVLIDSDHDRGYCEDDEDEESGGVRKRRTDWSEYVEKEVVEGRDLETKTDEVEIVTEWPEEVSRRQRRKKLVVDGEKCGSSDAEDSSRRNEHCGFQGRNTRQWPQAGDGLSDIYALLNGSSGDGSRWNGAKNQLQDPRPGQVGQPKTSKPVAAAKKTSKWSAYMTEDDGFSSAFREATSKDDCFSRIKNDASMPGFELMGCFGSEVSSLDCNDQTVEEDIHPDFV